MSRTVGLYGEARRHLAHPDVDILLGPLGLDPEVQSLVGAATVRPYGDGLYIPDDDGSVTAAIIPVMPNGTLIDLVAIDIARPDRWRRRTGLGDLLGENNIFGLFGQPLLVHPGPHEWLLVDGEGVVVLDFTPTACGLLRAIPGGLDVVDDPEFAERLERELSEPARRPTIYLRQQRAA